MSNQLMLVVTIAGLLSPLATRGLRRYLTVDGSAALAIHAVVTLVLALALFLVTGEPLANMPEFAVAALGAAGIGAVGYKAKA